MTAIKRMLLERYTEEGDYTGTYLAIGTLGDIDDYLSEIWASLGDSFDEVSTQDATEDDIYRLKEEGERVLFEYAKP